ncbi:MAG TPA: hypothetical protein VL173_10870 [Vicinamibacterales bacterium]|jgi:hypothetical protein|nr:hypothetical protein [Vicinamibacterales bacterium]
MTQPTLAAPVRHGSSSFRTLLLATIVSLGGVTLAHGQGYVGASISGDIARTGSASGGLNPGSGEALSFSLRAGAPMTSRVGVEFEFARPSIIERDQTPDVLPLDAALASDLAALGIPITRYTVHSEQRNTTMNVALTAAQAISPRLSVVYVGGVTFGRIERTIRYSFTPAPIFPLPDAKGVSYDTGPLVGVDVRLGLTDHVQVVPGIRLMGIANGWLVRPAVGLAWRF